MARHLRGTNVRLEADIFDNTDTNLVPTTSTVDVYDPSGRQTVSGATATAESSPTNRFAYALQTSAADPLGLWTFVFTSVSGTKTGKKEGVFTLYAAP